MTQDLNADHDRQVKRLEKTAMPPYTQNPERLTLATAEIGWRAYDAKDYPAALAFFEPYRNDPIGQHFIGAIYLADKNLRHKRLEGVALLKRAAAADTYFAWPALGKYYAEEGENQDLRQAIIWYAKGAEYGSSGCQFNLGWCYCRLEEFALASKWLFVSAVLGAEQGRHLFSLLFVKATSEQYEEGCRRGIEWLEAKRVVDESQLHHELRNWLSLDRESSLNMERDLSRIRTEPSL
jgi:hypothetical protein